MKKTSFNENWNWRHLDSDESWNHVTLPFDAMLREPRSAKAKGRENVAWFEGRDYEYQKTFDVPAEDEDQTVLFLFEGIYHNAEIYINGQKAAERPYGYTQILVDADGLLKYGEENVIRVIAHNADQPNSRWYSGAGIYRPVWVLKADREENIPLYGMKIRTLSYDPARVEISVETSRAGTVHLDILDAAGNAVIRDLEQETAEFDEFSETEVRRYDKAVFTVEIPKAKLWSPEHPNLYTARATFGEDQSEASFGVRLTAWDTKRGFTINGGRVILRGACIHSDNQLLGAEVYPEAEERRVRLLKKAGYNAIRSAHNPAAEDLLAACDRLGMLVMDEYVDMWYIHKTPYDYASFMPDWWHVDLKDMVDKDYNHPSVVLYSYGNEVSETADKRGVELCADMTQYLHSLDDTRPVTCGVNVDISLMHRLGNGLYSNDKAQKEAERAASGEVPEEKRKPVGSELYNQLAGKLGSHSMKMTATLRACDLVSRDAYANMDIAGYNYGILRYPLDLKAYPDRLILGTETFCRDAALFWKMAEKEPRILGDFVWAGQDYLGEAGIGSWEYEDYAPKNAPKEGWISAGSGRLDLTGKELGEALYTKVVFEQEKGPFLAVRPVYELGLHTPSSWKMTDAMPSWSWHGCKGYRANVEVYARAAKIHLYLNGRLVGAKKVHGCTAKFSVPYEDGLLEAVAYDAFGVETGTCVLRTAGEETKLNLIPEEKQTQSGKLSYIRIRYTDPEGIWKPMDHHNVHVTVENGELVRLGNGCPYDPDGFLKDTVRTYYGEALIIARADGKGDMRIMAEEGAARTVLTLPVI